MIAVCYEDGKQENWFRRLAKEFNIKKKNKREERRGLRGNRQKSLL